MTLPIHWLHIVWKNMIIVQMMKGYIQQFVKRSKEPSWMCFCRLKSGGLFWKKRLTLSLKISQKLYILVLFCRTFVKQETVHLILGRLNLKLLLLMMMMMIIIIIIKLLRFRTICWETMDQTTIIQQTQMKGMFWRESSQIISKTVQHNSIFSKLKISLSKLSHINNFHVTL